MRCRYILFYCASLFALRSCRLFLLYKLKICGNPTYVKQVISQRYLLTLCLCHILGILTIFLTFSLFCICQGDMCSLTLVLQKDHNSWNTQMMVTAFFLSNKVFLLLATLACGILVSLPGLNPGPFPVKARSPNHWTVREFPPLVYNATLNHLLNSYICIGQFLDFVLIHWSIYLFCVNYILDF